MGRFIQFAIAAADFALQSSGLKVDAGEWPERVGVYIGSGIGGFEVIEREHRTYLEHGPRRISPFFIPATIVNLASGYVSIRTGREGSELRYGHRLHHQRALDRRFVPHHSARRCRCHDLRRRRSLHHAARHRRVCRHARAFHAQRRSGSAPAARATGTAMASWWAKARAS